MNMSLKLEKAGNMLWKWQRFRKVHTTDDDKNIVTAMNVNKYPIVYGHTWHHKWLLTTGNHPPHSSVPRYSPSSSRQSSAVNSLAMGKCS